MSSAITLRERLLLFAARPNAALWIVLAIVLVGGTITSMVKGRLDWEAVAAAVVIVGLIEGVARVKDVPAWPWSRSD